MPPTTATPAPSASPDVPSIPGATASSPAAAASKAAEAVKGAKQPFNDAFAEIDALVAGTKPAPKLEKRATSKPQNVPKVKQESKTVELGKTVNPEPWELPEDTDKTPSKTPQDSAEEAEAADTPDDTEKAEETAKAPQKKPSPVESLRTAYEKSKTRITELENEVKRFRESPPEDPEKKSLAEKLEAIDKRRAELEDELRFANYERHPEYKEKYEAPISAALKVAYADIQEFDVITEDGNARKATPEEFNALVNMGSKQALAVAKELFGDAAPEVLAHRRKILELNESRKQAVEDYRKKGSEREAANAEATKKHHETMARSWEKLTKDAVEKYPQYFKPEDGDEDGNRLLEQGFKLADLAFTGIQNLKPDEIVKVHAAVRNKAAGFDRMVLRAKRLADRVSELETELAQFKESEPPAGDGAGEKAKAPASWEDEIDALARQR